LGKDSEDGIQADFAARLAGSTRVKKIFGNNATRVTKNTILTVTLLWSNSLKRCVTARVSLKTRG
jgi:hypothetical protein